MSDEAGAANITESASSTSGQQPQDQITDGGAQQPTGGEGGDTLLTGGAAPQPKEGEGEGGGEGGEATPYESFQMPEMIEGQSVDQGLIDAVSPIMQKYGLDQSAAQELVTAGAEYIVGQQKAAAETHLKQVDQWAVDAKADPNFGNGSDETFRENAEFAKAALAKYGSPELTKLLSKGEGWGLGNHPEVLKLLAKIGKDISPDGILARGGAGDGAESTAEILYGKK